MQPLAQERPSGAETKTMRVRRLEAIVVSSDDGLLIELGAVLGERYRTRSVDHPDQISTVTDSARWVAIVDAAHVADARGAVARLQQQYPGAEIIVVTPKPDEWSAAVARGAVLATIARDQLDSPKLLTALTAADSRLTQTPAPSSTSDAGGIAASGSSGAPKAGLRRLLPLIVVAALAAAAGLWWAMRPSHPLAPPRSAVSAEQSSGAAAAAPNAAKPQGVLELLSAARVAFRDQKTLLPRIDVEPRGDSALELYAQVLMQQPDNDEALDGLRRLLSVARGRVQSDLSGGKLDDAVRLVELFKSAGMDADSTRDLEASIASARPKWLFTHAQESIAAGDFNTAQQLMDQMSAAGADRNSLTQLQNAIESKKMDQQLAPLANEVKSAIDAGNLIDPANDNARTRLQAMRSVNRTHPMTLAAQRDLQSALLGRAQEATRKDQFDQAQRLLSAAADLGAGSDVTDAKRALQTEMDAASQRAAQAAADAKAKELAASSSSSSNGNASADKSAPHYLMARSAKPVRVSYPSAAADANIEGYATVEFTLHADGSATDASVVDSKPVKVFDRAAIDAVTHGKFDSDMLSGASSARARFRITFKLNH